MKPKFKVGDKVKIIDCGKIYDSYDRWATKYQFQNWKRLYGEEECDTYKSKFGTIVVKGKHEIDNKMLYGVECNNKTPIIIGEQGLEFVSKMPVSLPKSSKKKISVCPKCNHQTEFLVVNSSSPCFKCNPFSENPSGFRDKKLPPIPDVDNYGIYKGGLTQEEIKNYVLDFYYSMTDAQKEKFLGNLKKENYNINPDILYEKFCTVAGVNTQGVIDIKCPHCGIIEHISLMFRTDVETYTEKLFFNKDFLWD